MGCGFHYYVAQLNSFVKSFNSFLGSHMFTSLSAVTGILAMVCVLGSDKCAHAHVTTIQNNKLEHVQQTTF